MTLSKFLNELGLKPKNLNLFYDALTHTSFVNEKRTGNSYQRLEFIGDALLDMAVANYLYFNFPKMNEGDMTVMRASVVNADSLAKHAKDLQLDKIMRIGKGASEVKTNIKVLSDLFESISAAIYLDLGPDVFNLFMEKNIFKHIKEIKNDNLKNPKTLLQEFLQADSRGNINYKTFNHSKEKSMNKKFESVVSHDGILLGRGWGRNTKTSEVAAAKDALKKWKDKNETN